MTVDESARGNRTLERLTEVGRAPLEDALGVPVVEPTQAAVAMALGAVLGSGPART